VLQIKRLICDQLGSALSLRTKTRDPPKQGGISDAGNYRPHGGDADRTQLDKDPENRIQEGRALTGILGLLETRVSIDDERRAKSDADAKMRRDWMLAAAVIDRLFFIALIIVFTVGKLAFIVLFLVQ